MNLYDLENSKNSRKSGISKKKETEFHAKLDTLVHDTFGKREGEIAENAEGLNIGDPVIIAGDVQYKGKTGDIVGFGQDNRFVIVDLYNYGKHSFHSSDVSFNDYNGEEEELDEANPHNFDSDVDYYAAQNAPAKPRYRGTSSPGVNPDDEAYFREIFRKKRLAAQQAEKDKESGVAEGSDERKQNALWAQITAHEKAAKASKDLKRQHHLKMADQLRSQLKTSDNEQGVAEGWKDKVAGGALALGALGGLGALQNAAPNVTVQGHQMQLANPGTQPDDAKLVTTDDGKKVYAWKTIGHKNRSQWVYRPVEQVKEQGVAESYPKHQDLSGVSTDKLKAYLAKQGQQQTSGEGNQVKRVRAELQRREQGVAEGQLNEYLVRAGMPVKDVLALNLFQDTSPDGQEGMADDPRWSRLMKKYQPIANMLAKKIMALGKNRRLSDAEAEAIEQTWYDGSDAYDDMEVEYLADYYDQQIDIIEALLAGNITDEEFGMAEGEEMGTFAALKDWQVWNVHVYNNYYRGKYADYGPRPYSVVAGSPEEARRVIINNPDYVLQDLLSRKLQNGKKILPRGSALPVEEKRVGKAEPGSVTTMGLKKMLTPDGVQSFKFTNGKIVDGAHAQGGEEHGNGVDEFKRQALLPANKVAEGDNEPALSELSNELLGRYKKELGVRASAADKAGDYDKGHEYFKKINKATVRQGENDARKHEQDDMMETRLDMMRRAGYDL